MLALPLPDGVGNPFSAGVAGAALGALCLLSPDSTTCSEACQGLAWKKCHLAADCAWHAVYSHTFTYSVLWA